MKKWVMVTNKALKIILEDKNLEIGVLKSRVVGTENILKLIFGDFKYISIVQTTTDEAIVECAYNGKSNLRYHINTNGFSNGYLIRKESVCEK